MNVSSRVCPRYLPASLCRLSACVAEHTRIGALMAGSCSSLGLAPPSRIGVVNDTHELLLINGRRCLRHHQIAVVVSRFLLQGSRWPLPSLMLSGANRACFRTRAKSHRSHTLVVHMSRVYLIQLIRVAVAVG